MSTFVWRLKKNSLLEKCNPLFYVPNLHTVPNQDDSS